MKPSGYPAGLSCTLVDHSCRRTIGGVSGAARRERELWTHRASEDGARETGETDDALRDAVGEADEMRGRHWNKYNDVSIRDTDSRRDETDRKTKEDAL